MGFFTTHMHTCAPYGLFFLIPRASGGFMSLPSCRLRPVGMSSLSFLPTNSTTQYLQLWEAHHGGPCGGNIHRFRKKCPLRLCVLHNLLPTFRYLKLYCYTSCQIKVIIGIFFKKSLLLSMYLTGKQNILSLVYYLDFVKHK